MKWLTRRTSIVGVRIGNWEIGVGAGAAIIALYILIMQPLPGKRKKAFSPNEC